MESLRVGEGHLGRTVVLVTRFRLVVTEPNHVYEFPWTWRWENRVHYGHKNLVTRTLPSPNSFGCHPKRGPSQNTSRWDTVQGENASPVVHAFGTLSLALFAQKAGCIKPLWWSVCCPTMLWQTGVRRKWRRKPTSSVAPMWLHGCFTDHDSIFGLKPRPCSLEWPAASLPPSIWRIKSLIVRREGAVAAKAWVT